MANALGIRIAPVTVRMRTPGVALPPNENRDWFYANRANLGAFQGQYVAIHQRAVAGSDHDLNELVDRFTREHGDAPVFFGFVGDEPAFPAAAAL